MMTHRFSPTLAPVAAIFLMAGTACSLLPGGSLPTASSVTPTADTPPATDAAPPGPTATIDQTGLCPDATVGSVRYVSWDRGFCFLYPVTFQLQPGFERPEESLTLIGPVADPTAIESIAVVLTIAYNGSAEGMTSAEYAARWLELYAAGTDVSRWEQTIAGQTAVLLGDLPGAFVSERRAFVTSEGHRYTISLIPEPEDVPALEEEGLLAWETVTGSITFFGPRPARPYVRAEEVCPEATGDTSRFVRLVDGYCLLYPADFTPDHQFPGGFVGGPVVGVVEGWGEIRTSLAFGTFGTFPGRTPRQVLEPRLEFIDASSVQDATIGGQPAVVFRDPRGPWASKQAMIVTDAGFVYTIVAQPWEPERFPAGIEFLDRIWDTVTNSVAFFSKWN